MLQLQSCRLPKSPEFKCWELFWYSSLLYDGLSRGWSTTYQTCWSWQQHSFLASAASDRWREVLDRFYDKLTFNVAGTRLILQMVDSLGNTGGTGGSIYEVVQSECSGSLQKDVTQLMFIKDTDFTDCIVPAPSQDFKISSNITRGGPLGTCQPWRINIDGGRPPYTAVLDARNSPVITNVTIPSTDNAMVYINRADPGTNLFGEYFVTIYNLKFTDFQMQ